MPLEHLGRPQQNRRMHVVAAGVHIPVGGAEGKGVALLYLERVHIGPEQQGALPLSQGGHHPGDADVLRPVSQLREHLPDVVRRLGQLQTDLRNLVQRSAVRDHPRSHLLRTLLNVFQHNGSPPVIFAICS